MVNSTVDISHQNIIQILLKIFFHYLEIAKKFCCSFVKKESFSLIIYLVFIVKVMSSEIDELFVYMFIMFGIALMINVIQLAAFSNSFRGQHEISYSKSWTDSMNIGINSFIFLYL